MKNVECYWNLHRDIFSVRQRGKVIRHSALVLLRNARFVVQKGGRERVLREKVKNVHAFVKGELLDWNDYPDAPNEKTQITYNPYKYESFVTVEEREPIHTADFVIMVRINDRPSVYAVTLTTD